MLLKVVLDTNVIFEGLTKKGGFCGAIIEAWHQNKLRVCVSNPLIYEYEDVFARKLSVRKWTKLTNALVTLLNDAEHTQIYFSWRPSSPDPGDDFVIDCAMNAQAILITANIRDFRQAQQTLGLRVMSPKEFFFYFLLEDANE